jgi:hypothetical protein
MLFSKSATRILGSMTDSRKQTQPPAPHCHEEGTGLFDLEVIHLLFTPAAFGAACKGDSDSQRVWPRIAETHLIRHLESKLLVNGGFTNRLLSTLEEAVGVFVGSEL